VLIRHVNSSEEALNATTVALVEKPDTVFCMSDEILTGTMKAIQQAELKIPRDISVIAISNGFIPKLYHPEITYAETSGYKLGKLAFESMMACIENTALRQELTLESSLVIGGSI
jgi:LacI family transcriptional regulator